LKMLNNFRSSQIKCDKKVGFCFVLKSCLLLSESVVNKTGIARINAT